MFKFLLPLIAAIRVPLDPYRKGWGAGADVAEAYDSCKKALIRQTKKNTEQKASSQAATETQPAHGQS